MLSAFRQVFSTTRLQQLLPESFLFVTLDFNKDGKITNVTFILNKTSTITGDELEKLELAIESSVIVYVPNKEKTAAYYTPFNQLVKFQTVLDKTF